MLRLASHLVLGALLAIAQTTLNAADSAYPSKPIRLIVPFAPGGGADAFARTLQPGLASALGQQIVIDNRPGASSVIGTELAARAAPDGYTMVLITTTYTVNPALMKKLPYDPIKDLHAVSLAVRQPNILVVHPSIPAKSLKELVALAKTRGGDLPFASGGNGSQPHLAGELLQMLTGVKLIHVPFKGSGPGITALVGGQVAMMFVGPLGVAPHVKAGRLRALAVADKKRSVLLPDVPTVSEAGFPGLETGTWYGFLAPAGTPQPIVERFHGAVMQAIRNPAMKSRFEAQSVDIVGEGPREFSQLMREEIEKWGTLIKRAGIQPG